MHVFFQKEITRDHDLGSALENRGWVGHEIEAGNFHASVKGIEGDLTKVPQGEPIFGFASIRLAQQHAHLGLARMGSGMVVDRQKLTWSNYASCLPEDMLLNSDGILVPWGFLKREQTKTDLTHVFGANGVFLRPNSPFKPFTGFSTNWDDFEYNVNSYGQLEKIDPGELVAVFDLKVIEAVEWRFWIVAGEVATFSPYSWEELPRDNPDAPDGMMDDVSKVIRALEGYEDSLVIDMASTPDGNKVIELNGLSTSGFYSGMDIEKLLDALPKMYGY